MKIYSITLPNVTPIKLVTAKATYGIGFLTLVVTGFCTLFGIPIGKFDNKLEKAESLAMEKLQLSAKAVGADGIMDVHCQVSGLTVSVYGTAFEIPTAEKARIKAENEKARIEAEKEKNKIKEARDFFINASKPQQPAPVTGTCPYCGEIVKTKKCEMCGKENGLF